MSVGVWCRYWLMNCSPEAFTADPEIGPKLAGELYNELIMVPYMAKFVVFAQRRDEKYGQLRLFVVTDDKLDKTLESHQRFLEVARSDDVEVYCRIVVYVGMLLTLCRLIFCNSVATSFLDTSDVGCIPTICCCGADGISSVVFLLPVVTTLRYIVLMFLALCHPRFPLQADFCSVTLRYVAGHNFGRQRTNLGEGQLGANFTMYIIK